MSFIAARMRMVDAIFLRLGEDAAWTGSTPLVRVILREQNDDIRMGDSYIVGSARFVRVRRCDVATPAIGDLLEPAETGGTYEVIAEPLLDRRGIWTCEVSKNL